MTISEAEEFIGNNIDDYAGLSFAVSESENDIVILNQPAFVFPEHSIVCYEGVVWDKESDQADYSITAVFCNGQLDYIEQDGVAVTLHNYFTILGEDIDVYMINCDVKILQIEESENGTEV